MSFEKLAAAENAFLNSEVLSPVLQGQKIRVRIAGVVLNLSIKPKRYTGWGVFRAVSFKEAVHLRQPTFAEKARYFELFPALRFILCKNVDDRWYGVPLHLSDTRYKVSGLVPIALPEEVQMFEAVQTRFDGEHCWFERTYEKSSLKNALYLRESFAKFVEPEKLDLAGLTAEERAAYQIAWNASEEAKKSKEQSRIKRALERAGAEYRSHIDRPDSYTIEFVVDGRQHRSVVRKDTLEVNSSGICLAGKDRDFDLQSLVSVFREYHRGSGYLYHEVPLNEGDYDDDY